MRPNKSFCPNCGAQLAPVPQPPVQNPYVKARTQRAAEPTQFATPGGGQETPSLEIEFNHGGKSTYDLTKPVINIGRDPSNDIVIDTPVVSHFHAQIVREGNQLLLVHPHPSQPHTTNGLLYQGRHILGNEPFRKPLVRGDIFRIGDEHGTLVTLTYNDGSRAPQAIAPEIRPLPVGAPVSTLGSQSPHPRAQPQRKQQAQTHQPQPKKPRVMSTQVKIALIGALATIIAALITAKVIWPIPTPSIPPLHSSYTGLFSITRVSPGINILPSGPITFSPIKEDEQGQVQSGMTLDSAKYTCQGSVDTSRNLVLSCTLVSDTHFHVVVSGYVSQDSGQLSGTWSGSNSNNLSFYADATWSAQ